MHLFSHTFSAEATCVTEMSLMMACWKRNNFVEGLCSNETASFNKCVQNSQVGTRIGVYIVVFCKLFDIVLQLLSPRKSYLKLIKIQLK